MRMTVWFCTHCREDVQIGAQPTLCTGCDSDESLRPYPVTYVPCREETEVDGTEKTPQLENLEAARPLYPDLWCKYCGPDHPLRIELREEFLPRPLTGFSLAGNQLKLSAHRYTHPYAVCDHCKRECRGQQA